MSERSEQRPIDVLEAATSALRNTTVPQAPADLTASTLETLQSAQHQPKAIRRNQGRTRTVRLVRFSTTVGALGLIALIGGWWFLTNRTAAPAFADVVDRVAQAKSVSFVFTSTLPPMPGFAQIERKKFYVQGSVFRMEELSVQDHSMSSEVPPVLAAVIIDAEEKQVLRLDFIRKTAQRSSIGEHDASTSMNFMERFRNLTDQDVEYIGHAVINGRRMRIYRLNAIDSLGVWKAEVKEGGFARLWVDAESLLPVRIELVHVFLLPRSFFGYRATMVYDQFVWNQSLDSKLFTLEVPKGFTLEEK